MTNLIASINATGNYYDYSYESELGALGIAIFLIGLGIFTLITYLITSISLFILLKRANHLRPWSAFIPIWNTITFLEFGGVNKAWLWTLVIFAGSSLSSIPIIGWLVSLASLAISVIVTVYAAIGIQAGFGRGNTFGVVAAVLFYPIWLIWLAVVGKDWNLSRMRSATPFFWNDAVGKDNYQIFANEPVGANSGYTNNNPYGNNSHQNNPYGGGVQNPYGQATQSGQTSPYGGSPTNYTQNLNNHQNQNYNYNDQSRNNFDSHGYTQQGNLNNAPTHFSGGGTAAANNSPVDNNSSSLNTPVAPPENPFTQNSEDSLYKDSSENSDVDKNEDYVNPYDPVNYEDEINPSKDTSSDSTKSKDD